MIVTLLDPQARIQEKFEFHNKRVGGEALVNHQIEDKGNRLTSYVDDRVEYYGRIGINLK